MGEIFPLIIFLHLVTPRQADFLQQQGIVAERFAAAAFNRSASFGKKRTLRKGAAFWPRVILCRQQQPRETLNNPQSPITTRRFLHSWAKWPHVGDMCH